MPLTLEDIASLINSNKEEILSKVDGIVEDVKEVKTQVKDLTQRAESQEETNVKMNEKLQLLEKEIHELKKSPTPSFAQVASTSQPIRSTQPNPNQRMSKEIEVNEDFTKEQYARKLLSDGKRVV